MAKGAREIKAKDFVKDLRSGMKEDDILEKYGLSREKLQAVLERLVQAHAITQAERDSWLSAPISIAIKGDEPQTTEPPSGVLRRLRVNRNRPEAAQSVSSEQQPATRDSGDGQYRLKLYGRMTGDSDAFCADLAAVLGIDVKTAREYLDNVPVSVKEGLTEEKAERLRSILASVGALCLVEPMSREEEATVSSPREPTSPASREASIVDALLMSRRQKEEALGLFPTHVKPSLVALVGTVVFLASVGIYLLTSTQSVREEMALNPPVERSVSAQVKESTSASDEEALPAIKAQISYLESELPALFARLSREQTAFDLLVNTRNVEHDELQRKNAEVQSIREEIGLVQWQIRSLKKRETLLERTTALGSRTGEQEPGQSAALGQSSE
jgi:hypothetical protein